MKLSELNPEWVRWEDRIDNDGDVTPSGVVRTFIPTAPSLAEAQGIEFDCPKCRRAHRVQVAFRDRGVLDHHGSRDSQGRPSRWAVAGGANTRVARTKAARTRPAVLMAALPWRPGRHR